MIPMMFSMEFSMDAAGHVEGSVSGLVLNPVSVGNFGRMEAEQTVEFL